jgi:hypothetical protein
LQATEKLIIEINIEIHPINSDNYDTNFSYLQSFSNLDLTKSSLVPSKVVIKATTAVAAKALDALSHLLQAFE